MTKRLLALALLVSVASAGFAPSPASAVPPAVTSAIPDTTVAEDSPPVGGYRDLNAVFDDAEDGSALAFTIESNSNPGLVSAIIDADSALDMSFAPDASGSATLVIRAADSEALFAEDTLVVTVAPVNDLPVVVAAAPDTIVLVNSPPIANYVDLNDVFSDVENGSALTFSVRSNSDPSAVTVAIDADSAIDLSFFFDTHGEATIVVRAADSGGLFVEDSFVVTVHRTLWLLKPDGSGHEPTIQAAVNLAFDGDTLLLADGTYRGGGNHGIDLGGREILITSENGPGVTIIDAEGNDRVFLLDNVGPGGVLSNLTIRNGSKHQGACLKMSGASPTISGMIFAGNTAGKDGGAIWCTSGSSPTISGCVFIGNSAVEDGGAIYSDSSSPVIEDCTIVESSAGNGGAGIHMSNSTGLISNTIIALSAQGPGLACVSGSSFTVTCTDIFGNAGGDALCGTDGGGNISADPLFCGPPGSEIVSIAGYSPCAPAHNSCGVLIGARPVACASGPALTDTPNTLYPDVTFAGETDLVLHVGLDNFSTIGVMLDTTSVVVFSDSTHTYLAALANRTYVPGNARNFTATFSSAAVPPAIQAPVSYNLGLRLEGVDDSSSAYADTITTTARNSILVDTPKVIVSALPLRVENVLPGARSVPLLSLRFQNGYSDERHLDSLVVTHMTFGPGSPAELDAEIESLYLLDDVDSSGNVSGPDTLVAQTAFGSGQAVFATGGQWSVAGMGRRNLVLTADIDSTLARDGDAIDAAVVSPSHVLFQGDTETNGDFSPLYPLDSFGYEVVDGMAGHQIGVTPSAVDTLFGDTPDVWILSLLVPQNGYESDTLTALSIKDYAGDFSPIDIASLRVYRDDGNTLFDPASDTDLGELVYSGDRYEISGLFESLSPPARFFIAADVANHAVDGHHFRPGVPLGGIEVTSSNDGPVDNPVLSSKTLAFENPEVIEVTGVGFAPDVPNPGDVNVRLLLLAVENKTRQPVTLDSLRVTNGSKGAGSPDDLDHTFSNVRIYNDDGDGVIEGTDALLSENLGFTAGSLAARNLDLGVAPDETVHLLVASDIDSFCAADGDTLEVRVNAPGDVGIREARPVTGNFPVATPGPLVVDGMKAFQIALFAGADSLIVTGGSRILVLDVGIPANGYAADILGTFTIRNEGTATSEHFDRIALFVDGGDGVYDAGAGDDTFAGNLVENPAEPGKSFLIAGLAVPLTPPCGTHTRLYAAADIAQEYSVAGTIRFSIPVMGLRVASGNDGPIDAPVVEPSMRMIPKPDRLTVFPYPVGDRIVYPGSKGNSNFGVGFFNAYTYPLVLHAIKLYQVGTASSAEIDSVAVYADTDGNGLFDPAADARLDAVSATGVSYVFDDLDIGLDPRKISYLFVTYDLPLSVSDSSTVDLRLFDATDITVEPLGSLIEGDFPLNSPGTDAIDGMIARQITLANAPPYNASPNNENIPAMTLVIPSNGVWPDVLDFVTIENQGTAVGGTDVARVRLWKEAGGDPAKFDPGEEDPLDDLDWNGSSWENPLPIGEPIPTSGLRVHVTFSVTADPGDGTTVRARLPLDGIHVASGNDGPIDKPLTNPTQQTISTDPLIATLITDQSSYSAGQTIVLSMIARNEGLDTLFGVHPSIVTLGGTGGASLSSLPNPALVDLVPGSNATFVWTFSAGTAGDATFCARAYSADSTVVSEETCTETVLIQNRPSGVSMALTNLAPSTADRGQDNVKLFKLQTQYTTTDSLAAPVHFTGILIHCEDVSGAPLAPNAVLSRIVFAGPSGMDHVFSVADSTNATLRLTMPQPMVIQPGAALTLGVDGDISDAAAFTSLVMKIATLGDIGLSDANDGTELARTSANAFPWATTPLSVNSPAESLLVDSENGATKSANVGQENVRVFTIDLAHPGDPNSARVILSDLRLGFFDLTGIAITPGSVVRRLRIAAGASVLFDDDVVSGSGVTLAATLHTPLVLPPGSSQALDIYVDLKIVPQSGGFFMVLANPGSVTARDINTNQFVRIGPADPSARVFPFSSDRVVFQNPASALLAAFVDRLPTAILPSARTVPVMDIIVTQENIPDASAVRVDSLSFQFLFPGGAPALPGDYFGSLIITHEGDTVGAQTTLSGTSPSVECRLTKPVVLVPSASETLSVFVDTKALLSPADIEVRVDQEGIVIRDVNDGTRIFGMVGPFPFVAGPTSLQLPSSRVSAGLVSRVPANIAAQEPNLSVFDVVVKNGDSAGRTAIGLETIRVRAQSAKESTVDPTRIARGARLITGDSTVVDGVIGPSEILFTLPSDLVRIASASSDTVSIVLDIDTDIDDANFRLVVEDSASIGVYDDVAGSRIPVGTLGDTGFPLTTRWVHVLGQSAQAAYTNYPNPFAAGREHTTITYYLEQRSTVTLKLYAVWGAPVATLVDNKSQDPGLHQNVKWDGRNGDGHVVNNGVYYLVLEIREENGKNVTLKRKVGVIR